MNKKINLELKNISFDSKKIITDYAADKVIDWVLKNKVEQGFNAKFEWSEKDKALLKKMILDPKNAPKDLPLHDKKFHLFFESIIDNGINTDDTRLFQYYKNKLPLRALGLTYDIRDFQIKNNKLLSVKKIDSGFYMLEITLSPKAYNSKLAVTLSLKNEQNVQEENFLLNVQSDKIAKRLIKIDSSANIIVSTNAFCSPKDIKHFKLARLTEKFFLSRLYKKIGKNFDIENIKKLTSTQLNQLWIEYDKIFESDPYTSNFDYHKIITLREKALTPKPRVQMQNLVKWLSK